jgi:hypothetical protein
MVVHDDGDDDDEDQDYKEYERKKEGGGGKEGERRMLLMIDGRGLGFCAKPKKPGYVTPPLFSLNILYKSLYLHSQWQTG